MHQASAILLAAPIWSYAIAYGIGAYLALGLAFALWFAVAGNRRMLPALKGAGFWLRLLMLPGSVLLWPLLLQRVVRGPVHEGFPLQAQRGRAKSIWMVLAAVVPVLFVGAVSAFGERPQTDNLAERLGRSPALPAHAQRLSSWRSGSLYRLDTAFLLRVHFLPLVSPDPRWVVDGQAVGALGARGMYETVVVERPVQYSVVDGIRGDTLFVFTLPE